MRTVKRFRLIVLSENCVRQRGLLAEHGWSVLIETESGQALFDTGQGMALEHNAARLGIDLNRINVVALSHGHYDHTGGLPALAARNARMRVVAHPDAWMPKFQRKDALAVRASDPQVDSGTLRERFASAASAEPVEILPGVWTTGEISRETDYEDTGGAFFLDEKCHKPDPLKDDMALLLCCEEGVFILCGCAHAGLGNTLDAAMRVGGRRPILGIAGGFHLQQASGDSLERTAERVREAAPPFLGPSHCTGAAACDFLSRHVEAEVRPLHVGSVFQHPDHP